VVKNLLLVAVGGSCGAMLRYLASCVINSYQLPFYLTTLICNCLASFLIGFLATFLANPHLKLLLITGFLGALSTFSSFNLDTVKLMEQGLAMALANVALNICLTFGSCYLGMRI
jgi:CrcB protein